MKTFNTASLPEDLGDYYGELIYCGLDGLMTQSLREILPQDMAEVRDLYEHARRRLPAYLGMSWRGFKIDQGEVARKIPLLDGRIANLMLLWDALTEATGEKVNPRSTPQLVKLFYTTLAIPKITRTKKGKTSVAVDRKALEKIERNYLRAVPFAKILMRLRDLEKIKQVLTKELRDGRWHCTFNIGGTNTGRRSSSSDPFGYGANIQNIDKELRSCFIADDDHVLFQFDQQGAESRAVAYLSGDENYIKAVESGDAHSMVAGMVFGLTPTKEFTEVPYYRDKTYRHMAKVLGHGCVTGDHEVLTKHGWEAIEDVGNDEEIAVWSDGEIHFEKPAAWNTHEFSGELWHFEGNAYDLLCTPNHRIPFVAKGKTFEKTADDLPNWGQVPVSGELREGKAAVTEQQARLCAAYQADGSSTYGLDARFHFKKDRKIERLKTLLGDIPYSERMTKAGTTVVDVAGEYACVFTKFGKTAGAYLLDWPLKALKAFVDELKYWDGSIGKTSVWLTSANSEHLGWLNTIIRLCGFGSQVASPKISGYGSTIHAVSINARRYASPQSMTRTRVAYEGKVYCPTVSTSWFLVRRNGKIMVTGNSNYLGQERTMAMHASIEVKVAEDFQARYFKAFPGIKKWQLHKIAEVQRTGRLTTPFGRRRVFWGRLSDDSVLREAIAYEPQSMVGEITAIVAVRLHRMKEVKLLADGHDSVIFQVHKDLVDSVLPRVQDALKVTVPVTDIKGVVRDLTIPWDGSWGYNWGPRVEEKKAGAVILVKNPNGLVDYGKRLPGEPVPVGAACA